MSLLGWFKKDKAPAPDHETEAFVASVLERPQHEQLPDPDRVAEVLSSPAQEQHAAMNAALAHQAEMSAASRATRELTNEERSRVGFPASYPFVPVMPLPSPILRPLPIPLWDREPYRFTNRRINFFQVQVGGVNALGEIKNSSDTNMCDAGQLGAPNEFSFLSVNVLYEGHPDAVRTLVGKGTLKVAVNQRAPFVDIPLRVLKSFSTSAEEQTQISQGIDTIFDRLNTRAGAVRAASFSPTQIEGIIRELRSALRRSNQGHKVTIGRNAVRLRSRELLQAWIEVDPIEDDIPFRVDVTLVCYGLFWEAV